jgi:hypothetical protein
MRILLTTLAFLLAACGQGDQTVAYRDSEGNTKNISVENAGGTRTVTSEDGMIRAVGTQGGKDARFPDFAPQYPGAKVQNVTNMNLGPAGGSGFKQHIITMQTTDSPEAVVAFYKGKIAAQGKRLQEIKTGSGPMLVIGGTSPADMDAAVTVMPVPSGGTSVNVTVQERT